MSARALAAILPLVLVLTSVASASSARFARLPLAEISDSALARCERSGLLHPVCPRLVPRTPGYGSSLYVEPFLDVFDLGYGAEYPSFPERNRPPAMLHMVVAAGDVERLTPFRDPRSTNGATLRDGLMRRDRTRPVSFGRARWGGRAGALYLAPPYGYGGMLGNHLVFSWREQGRGYSLSLHAWEPLSESAETLRTMVETLPSPQASKRLARLAAVRWLSLPGGVTSATAGVTTSNRIRALDVRIVARVRTELEVAIDTPAGRRLPVLRSTQSRLCGVRPPYRLCYVRLRTRAQTRSGRWTVHVSKRSEAPAQVRIDVLFRTR